jgi:hypothetical protein
MWRISSHFARVGRLKTRFYQAQTQKDRLANLNHTCEYYHHCHHFCDFYLPFKVVQRFITFVNKVASYDFAVPTHSCGEVTSELAGRTVTVGGWLDAKRAFASTGSQKGALIFLGHILLCSPLLPSLTVSIV